MSERAPTLAIECTLVIEDISKENLGRVKEYLKGPSKGKNHTRPVPVVGPFVEDGLLFVQYRTEKIRNEMRDTRFKKWLKSNLGYTSIKIHQDDDFLKLKPYRAKRNEEKRRRKEEARVGAGILMPSPCFRLRDRTGPSSLRTRAGETAAKSGTWGLYALLVTTVS
jgi:hypothetical protein